MRGATFHQLHLLMDKHASEQEQLVDELVIEEVREAAHRADALGDDGSNDLLVSGSRASASGSVALTLHPVLHPGSRSLTTNLGASRLRALPVACRESRSSRVHTPALGARTRSPASWT